MDKYTKAVLTVMRLVYLFKNNPGGRGYLQAGEQE